MDRSNCFTWRWFSGSAVLLCGFTLPTTGVAQQVTLAAPVWSGGQNFVSATNVNFGLQFTSPDSVMFFRSGGPSTGLAAPAFGGLGPGGGWSLGVGGANGGWSWNLGIHGVQGSSRQSTSVTPMLTLADGGFGFINNSIQRPFVTGFVPVVGDWPSFDAEVRQLQQRAFTQRFYQALSVLNAQQRADEEAEERLYQEHQQRLQSRQQSRLQNGTHPLGSSTATQMDEPLVLKPN